MKDIEMDFDLELEEELKKPITCPILQINDFRQ